MSDLPMITNRALTPPPARPAAGPFRIVQRAMAALTVRFDRSDTRLARLEADLNELREQIDAKGKSFVYASGFHALFEGRINLEGDRFRVVLLSDTYLPDESNHAMRADVASHALTGVGSQPVTVSKTKQLGKLVILLGPGAWNGVNIRARFAAYYRDSGGGADHDDLIFLADFGKNVVSRGGPFDLAESMFTL
ncbi:MAG: hypothetical protein K0R61_2079 [Microvirga sp.]|jgi:hypothetical protein|nr:hypothetical protein [Microvirga sp.]